MDLFAAQVRPFDSVAFDPKVKRFKDTVDNQPPDGAEIEFTFELAYRIKPLGPSFLKEKGRLKVQIERNLHGEISHDSKWGFCYKNSTPFSRFFFYSC
jgi:hypothetical protein